MEGGGSRSDTCHRVYAQQRAQVNAVDAAVKNLDFHVKRMSTTFADFSIKCDQQQKNHQQLLDSFEADLAQLRQVDLHPSVRTAEKTTLLDCVNEGKLRAWAQECQKSYDQLAKKVLELRGLRDSIEASVLKLPSPPLKPLEEIGRAVQQECRDRSRMPSSA
eukprot:TRINITY_DN4441_c0_g1_i1.p1 TRINITY_DN4441_c0_g1~~TRINITY_DN4441_c0_g1_i1.p1  ORF type:complete len:162 (+),score=23.74 TRINITY_DN4441_c0_g1_i1:298-783(+)